MPLALVTGPPDLLRSAGAALGRAGFDVVSGEAPPLPAAGPFDCYVQLPCTAGAPVAPGRVAAPDLVCRIDALAAVAGRLRPDASVILGVDEPGGLSPGLPAAGSPTAGSPTGASPAGADLLAAVALALLEDLGRSATRLAVLPVAELCRPPAEAGGAGPAQWEMPTPPLVSAP